MALKSNSVLIVQRRMTKYRAPLFDRMKQRLVDRKIRLNVLSGTPMPDEVIKRDGGTLSWALEVPCRYWKFNKLQFAFQPIPEALLRQQDLVIIPHENSMIYNYWLLLRRRFSKPRMAFWGHGSNFQIDKKNSYKEKLKSWTATQVDWWFAYTQLSVDKIIPTGFPEDRISCLNNTVDVEKLLNFRKSISQSEIESIQKKLGLDGKHVGIFIGSLYPEKRLDFLFEAAEDIRQRLPNFELIIIGDGPLRDMAHNAGSSKPWIQWVGAKHGREKVLYMSLGHVMLNPGLVGLGILDSFVMNLPMVTTDCGIHSPEIAYLESGRNGLMTTDDLRAYVEGSLSLLTNPALHNSMAADCEKAAKRYSLHEMVENFNHGILKALEIDNQ